MKFKCKCIKHASWLLSSLVLSAHRSAEGFNTLPQKGGGETGPPETEPELMYEECPTRALEKSGEFQKE